MDPLLADANNPKRSIFLGLIELNMTNFNYKRSIFVNNQSDSTCRTQKDGPFIGLN